MNDLAALLAGLERTSRLKAAREHAPRASAGELIHALQILQPRGPAEDFLVDELARRGPVESIAQALLSDPLSPAAESFSDALFQLSRREPDARATIAATLIQAASAALDAGGGSAGASTFIWWLASSSRFAGPLPEAAPVAERLLATVASEQHPCLFPVGPAEHLAGMSTLAARLAALGADVQEKVAREQAPSTSLEELIRAVRVIEPIGPAGRCLAGELARRGPDAVDSIARALLADPLSEAAETFCEALARLHEQAPEVRGRVAAVLIQAAGAVLDTGGSSRDALAPIHWLHHCAASAGPLPEAAPVAQRLLALAAVEEAPYLPAVGAAERLAGVPLGRLAELLDGLDLDGQVQAVLKYAASAALDEVIEAVRLVQPQRVASHLVTELSSRGPGAIDPIARALLSDPRSPAAGAFGEALVQLLQREPEARDRIVAPLIQALGAVLDAGGGTRAAYPLILFLADCVSIAGPLPETAPVAGRLVAVAAGEDEPYVLTMDALTQLAAGG